MREEKGKGKKTLTIFSSLFWKTKKKKKLKKLKKTTKSNLTGEPLLDWRVIQLPLDDLSRLLKVKVAPPATSAAAAGEKGKGGGAAAAAAAAATGRQRTAAAVAASPSLKASAHSGAAAPLPPKSAAALAAAASAAAGGMRAPSVYRGTLVVPEAAKSNNKNGEGAEEKTPTAAPSSLRDAGGHPPSTWADLSGWGKGLLFVNGVNLGYYWPAKGPQTRQYVPGPILKTGGNEIVLIELEAGGPGTLSFASEPDFRGRVMPAAGVI